MFSKAKGQNKDGQINETKIDNRDQLQRKMLANRYSDLIGKMDN